MSDGRRNNGNKGHSTKARSLNDRRLNPAKKLLKQYLEEEFDFDKFKALMNKLYDKGMKGDVKSTTLFMAYTVGKPKESIDLTSGDEPINNFSLSDLSKAELAILLKIHERNNSSPDAE